MRMPLGDKRGSMGAWHGGARRRAVVGAAFAVLAVGLVPQAPRAHRSST